MFSTLSEREIIISAIFILSSINAFNLDQYKIFWDLPTTHTDLLGTVSLSSAKCFQLGPVKSFVIWERINPFPNDKAQTIPN